jgi:hypothetical protein
LNDWSFEARYLGTRGVHLLTQNRISNFARVAPDQGRPGLPTFIGNAPTQAQIDALPGSTLSLSQIQARSVIMPAYAAAGFGSGVVAFLSNGNSTYHGASGQLQKRFSKGLQMTAAYTWSKLIDDTTAEVFSTVLSPRRVQDFQNLRNERAISALDRTHRFVTAWIYELPWYRNDKGWAGTLLGGFNIAGTYTAESGEAVTIRSGNDSNQNGDSAGDRAIFNPSGQQGVGSAVTALVRTCPSSCRHPLQPVRARRQPRPVPLGMQLLTRMQPTSKRATAPCRISLGILSGCQGLTTLTSRSSRTSASAKVRRESNSELISSTPLTIRNIPRAQ